MNQSKITIIVNGQVLKLSEMDTTALQNISDENRQQLVNLLEKIKTTSPRVSPLKSPESKQTSQVKQQSLQPKENDALLVKSAHDSKQLKNPKGRMGAGDVDLIMGQLIEQQKNKQKPIPGAADVIKWFLIIMLLIIFLIMIF